MTRPSFVVGAVVAVGGLLAFACGGKVIGDPIDDTQGGGSSRGGSSPGGGTSTDPSPGPRPPSTPGFPGADCKYVSGGGSGGGGNGTFQCTVSHDYVCSAGSRYLSCSCSGKVGAGFDKGTCSCKQTTGTGGTGSAFPFDCTNGCAPGPEVFAKCGVPMPPSDPGGGGGSSSTSSGG